MIEINVLAIAVPHKTKQSSWSNNFSICLPHYSFMFFTVKKYCLFLNCYGKLINWWASTTFKPTFTFWSLIFLQQVLPVEKIKLQFWGNLVGKISFVISACKQFWRTKNWHTTLKKTSLLLHCGFCWGKRCEEQLFLSQTLPNICSASIMRSPIALKQNYSQDSLIKNVSTTCSKSYQSYSITSLAQGKV